MLLSPALLHMEFMWGLGSLLFQIMSMVGFLTGALFDNWETRRGLERDKELRWRLTIGLLADLNWFELDLDRMGSGTSGPLRMSRSWRVEGGDTGLTGTVLGMLECWPGLKGEMTVKWEGTWVAELDTGLRVVLPGGLRVNLLGLTAGPPDDRLLSS